MQHSEPRKEAGFTFAELAFAMLILVVGATVLVNHLTVNFQTTATERDRVFAYSKAQAILSEIQSLVDRGGVEAAVDLDEYDDGVVNKYPLTIQTEEGLLVSPAHVLSGNYQRNGAWVWSRRISVQPFAGINNRNVRYVTVRIFKRDNKGVDHPMADLSAVINSAGGSFPTTQVFDIYLLAVENIPGWWVFMESMKPFVESMITDLENRNPGLSFRTHWITKAAYGRNQGYRPFINEAVDSLAPITEVYHYPGRMPAGNASTYYYVPDMIKGRINLDGADWNGYDATLNPYPYALADFFNHAMRYPDEYALWQRKVAAIEQREQDIKDAIASGNTPPSEFTDMSKEPTLRILLDEMATDPDKYRHAMVINLHGELLPMPALRNYSDAAKDPSVPAQEHWRVVTHPEELRTRLNDGGVTDDLKLRMYAYVDNRSSYTGADRMSEPMVVELVGLDLIDHADGDEDRLHANADLEYVYGGVPVGGSTDYPTSWQPAVHADDVVNPAEQMYYTAEFVHNPGSDPFTRIYLYNTPLICPLDTNNRGLAATRRARLYDMEYVPCPIDKDSGTGEPVFEPDLTDIGTTGPKNTARWTLTLDKDVLTDNQFVDLNGSTYNPTGDVQLQIRTRIASGFSAGSSDWQTSGQVFPTLNQPDNLSTTYAWWTDSKEDVPMTERAQFNGDPRHVPYKDCFDGGNDFPNSYNWYHSSLANTDPLTSSWEDARSDFASLNNSVLANRWGGSMWCDVPRYFELLRTALVRSGGVYNSLTGFSYYYMGIGNDIGYDGANGYPNSIPSDMTPHYGSGSGYINTITGQRKLVATWDSGSSSWWAGYPWLGELYPDWKYNEFYDTTGGTTPPRGNLTAGSALGSSFQYRTSWATLYNPRRAYGARIYDNHQRTSVNGCSTFFNIGTSSSRFRHVFSGGNATLTSAGSEVSDGYNMEMPATAPVSRPFQLNYPGSGGTHWNHAPYTTRYTGTLYETYYSHSAGTGSGLVKLVDPANTSAAYIVVNGIDKTVTAGTSFIAKWAVLSLTHSFFEVGETSNSHRIPQLPRVEIQSPTDITELDDPATIDVLYDIEWTRWDGQPYTNSGTYAEDESDLEYVLMYSRDNGINWLYVQDDSPAIYGQRPTDSSYIRADAFVGGESYTWTVDPSSFPEGSYLLRVECYRQGTQVHYAWHQNRIYIQR